MMMMTENCDLRPFSMAVLFLHRFFRVEIVVVLLMPCAEVWLATSLQQMRWEGTARVRSARLHRSQSSGIRPRIRIVLCMVSCVADFIRVRVESLVIHAL